MALAATVICALGVMALAIVEDLVHEWSAVFAMALVVALLAGSLSLPILDARATGASVLRVGRRVVGIVHRSPRSARMEWVRPQTFCMACPSEGSSSMRLRAQGSRLQWICGADSTHSADFDEAYL